MKDFITDKYTPLFQNNYFRAAVLLGFLGIAGGAGAGWVICSFLFCDLLFYDALFFHSLFSCCYLQVGPLSLWISNRTFDANGSSHQTRTFRTGTLLTKR